MEAKVQNGIILDLGPRPKWRYPQNHDTNPGEIITDDAVYIAGGLEPSPDTAGWYPVSDEAKPSHDPAREHPPQAKPYSEWTVGTNRVVRTWHAPVAKAVDEVVSEKINQINQKYTTILNGGFTYDFGSKTATLEDGTTAIAGVRTLQTRPNDRERWSATNQVAVQYIGAGMPTEPMRPFRTADNARVSMTAQGANDCINAMQAKFGLALDAMWDHKDAIRQLTDVDAVIAYDDTTLWP